MLSAAVAAALILPGFSDSFCVHKLQRLRSNNNMYVKWSDDVLHQAWMAIHHISALGGMQQQQPKQQQQQPTALNRNYNFCVTLCRSPYFIDVSFVFFERDTAIRILLRHHRHTTGNPPWKTIYAWISPVLICLSEFLWRSSDARQSVSRFTHQSHRERDRHTHTRVIMCNFVMHYRQAESW